MELLAAGRAVTTRSASRHRPSVDEARAFVAKADIWCRQDWDLGPLRAAPRNNLRMEGDFWSQICMYLDGVLWRGSGPCSPVIGRGREMRMEKRGGRGQNKGPVVPGYFCLPGRKCCRWLWHALPLPSLIANTGRAMRL